MVDPERYLAAIEQALNDDAQRRAAEGAAAFLRRVRADGGVDMGSDMESFINENRKPHPGPEL